MQEVIRYMSMVLTQSLMIMSFILAPIPFKNISLAGDSTNTKIYVPGTEFNENLSKTELKEHYADGVVGIIEQYIAAIFAVIGLSLVYNPIPDSLVMCPQNQGAIASFPLVQAGSLSYLIQEVRANSKFDEASKIAVDKVFAAKKDENYYRYANKKERVESQQKAQENEDDNNKQLEAYDVLHKIYTAQVDGLDSKIHATNLMSLALASSFAIEGTNILTMNASCTSSLTPLLTLNKGALKTFWASGIAAVKAASASYVALGPYGAPGVAACGTLATLMNSYVIKVEADETLVLAQGSAELLESRTLVLKDQAKLAKELGAIPVSILTGAMVPALTGSVEAQIAKDSGISFSSDTQSVAMKSLRQAFIGAMTASLCLPANTVVAGLAQKVEINRAVKVFCCGGPSKKGRDLDAGHTVPAISFSQSTPDQRPTPTIIGANSPTRTLLKDEKYYVKIITENALKRIAMETMYEKFPNNPLKEVRQIAKIDKQIKYIMDNQDALLEESNLKKEYDALLERGKTEDISSSLINLISKIKNEIFIGTAKADVNYMSLLGLGVKITLLLWVMRSWLREHAFPKPKTRLWTWATMLTINEGVAYFDRKSRDDAKDRLSVVLAEKEAFLKSHVLRTKLDEKKLKFREASLESSEGNATASSKGNLIRACAVPKGDGFAPAVCPSLILRKRFNFPAPAAFTRSSSGKLNTRALSLLGDVAFAAASKGLSAKSSLSSGKLAEIESISRALKQNNAKLVKKLDSLEKENARVTKTKPALLGSSIKTFRKLFSGNPSSSGVTKAQLSGNTGLASSKIKELKKSKTHTPSLAAFKMPKIERASMGGGFDFDIATSESEEEQLDDSQGLEKENISDFVLNENVINENDHVNIFKIISNRYLLSYPVLLEEESR